MQELLIYLDVFLRMSLIKIPAEAYLIANWIYETCAVINPSIPENRSKHAESMPGPLFVIDITAWNIYLEVIPIWMRILSIFLVENVPWFTTWLIRESQSTFLGLISEFDNAMKDLPAPIQDFIFIHFPAFLKFVEYFFWTDRLSNVYQFFYDIGEECAWIIMAPIEYFGWWFWEIKCKGFWYYTGYELATAVPWRLNWLYFYEPLREIFGRAIYKILKLIHQWTPEVTHDILWITTRDTFYFWAPYIFTEGFHRNMDVMAPYHIRNYLLYDFFTHLWTYVEWYHAQSLKWEHQVYFRQPANLPPRVAIALTNKRGDISVNPYVYGFIDAYNIKYNHTKQDWTYFYTRGIGDVNLGINMPLSIDMSMSGRSRYAYRHQVFWYYTHTQPNLLPKPNSEFVGKAAASLCAFTIVSWGFRLLYPTWW